MSELLARSQEQLETHFAELASSRPQGGVVFALEHGLDPVAWEAIADALRAALRVSAPRSEHWLLWVTYAAEHGYSFDGEEFWQSFEASTPYWRVWGSRDQVRTWFRRFKQRFSGIEPKGAWANHFSIICWPITHAILPRDLQFQFARTLHQAKHSLVSSGTTDAKALGRLVRREAWHANSRFQQFVQQEELVGRLVLAILGAEVAEGGKIILPATLDRIVTDLEKTRQAKEWLDSARRTVTRFKGADNGGTRGPSAKAGIPAKPRPPSIRPTLIMRRGVSSRWDVAVDVPTLADLARETDGLRDYLLRTRTTISGGDGIWAPSSWLLGSGREKALVTWPGTGEPILKFERADPNLELLLRAEGTLTPGPVWLCRIRDDGTAVEVLGRQVRPGTKYVLLHEGDISADTEMLEPCDVSCTGVAAYALTLPAALTPTDEAVISHLQLTLCRTIRIWPAGLAARKWDGEGSGEWLTTESPSFAVRHDHALSHLMASLDGGAEVKIPAGQAGQTAFLSLPPLSPGEHILRVRAVGNGAAQRPIEGAVAITVREPAAWVPGTTAHGGMAVITDPGAANLDDLLNDRLAVSIQGPPDRQVEVTLRTLVPPGETALVRRQIKLPVNLSRWTQMLGEHGEEEIAVSSRAELLIRGDELGLYRIELEREAAPLRWSVRRQPSMVLRLIDEAGSGSPPKITHAPFSAPAGFTELEPDQFHEGVPLTPPGGLYWVHGDECDDSLIVSVPPQGTQHGFDALGITPRLAAGSPSPRVTDILSASIVWRNARAVGALGSARKTQVVQFLDDVVVSLVCGLDWATAEIGLRSIAPGDQDFTKLGEGLGNSYEAKGFSAVLRRATPDIACAGRDAQSRWFAEVARRYGICKDAALAEEAFKIAADPLQAFGERGDKLEQDLDRFADLAVLLRGARLAAFILARRATP